MRFVLIGAGGIGGWLMRSLAPMLEYTDKIKPEDKTLVVVDGDSFEPKNFDRQDFDMLGPKPHVRCAELAPRYGMVNFVPLHQWVVETVPESGSDDGEEGEGNATAIAAADLIQDGDVVICVVDNFACRAVVTEAASKLDNVDVFHAGNDDGFFGSYYHYSRKGGNDITRNPLWKDEFANPTDRNPGELSCEERAQIDGGTQIIFVNMAVAAAVGAKIQKVIVDEERVPGTDEFFMELDKGKALSSDRTEISETEAPAEVEGEQVLEEATS